LICVFCYWVVGVNKLVNAQASGTAKRFRIPAGPQGKTINFDWQPAKIAVFVVFYRDHEYCLKDL
jgi:hypothetical protein